MILAVPVIALIPLHLHPLHYLLPSSPKPYALGLFIVSSKDLAR